jgi:hypothetical protein
VKVTHQYVCLSFELPAEKKKHFYRFDKQLQAAGQPHPADQPDPP